MFGVYKVAREAGWKYADCSIELLPDGTLEIEASIAPHAGDYDSYFQVSRLFWDGYDSEKVFEEIACELRGILIEYSHINPGRGL